MRVLLLAALALATAAALMYLSDSTLNWVPPSAL